MSVLTNKFLYLNLEITLIKMDDSVIIQILDNELCKSYNAIYNDNNICEWCNNIKIFYSIMKTSFETLIEPDDQKAIVNIKQNNNVIIINVHHIYYIEYIFDLQIYLDNVQPNPTDIVIKKLEYEHNLLKKFIDDYMEVCVGPCHLKINTKNIHISWTHDPNNENDIIDKLRNRTNLNDIYYIRAVNWDFPIFNDNFKIIKCNKIIIQDVFNCTYYDNSHPVITRNNLLTSFCDFPSTLSEIVYISDKGNLLDFRLLIKEGTLLNLKQLEINGNNDLGLQTIYEKIKHLNLKKIIIRNCPKFREFDLLKSNGIIVEIY